MKKRNVITYICLCVGLLFAITSCDDKFLDRQPIDFLSPDNFSSERDIREAVNGIYRGFISDVHEPIYTDFIVDNGYQSTYQLMWTGNFNNETPQVINKWQRNYRTILRANTVLHYIDNVTMPESSYNQYKGEALFFRALCYFDLTFFYGDVPLRLKPEGLDEADKPLTLKAEILDMVMDDLETAAELLPESYLPEERGRATKGAALAIKARALLFNHRYEEAADYCQKVRDLDVYEIYEKYDLLFLPDGETENKEVIFDMQYEKNTRQFGLSNFWYTRLRSWSYLASYDLYEQYYSSNGLSIHDPNNTLYNPSVFSGTPTELSTLIREGGTDNRFMNRDPRMRYSLVVPYTIRDWNAATGAPILNFPFNRPNTFTSFNPRKYIDYSDNGVNDVSGVNPVIIRYADVLLMEAEALVESGTYDEAHVCGLINQVRQRPGVMMPKVEDVEGPGLSPEDLIDVIRHERRVELAFEGLRIFDVIRWEIGAEVYKDLRGYVPAKLTNTPATIEYEVYPALRRSWNPSRGYQWPIPKVELDANKGIVR